MPTQQLQTPGTNQPQIDQTALELSRAIRQAEGGDYTNTSGDASTSAGAYQFNNGKLPLKQGEIPANFKSWAKEVNLDPNDFSQTNQDHVAYERIKRKLDAGQSQSSIAAEWNSGLSSGWENHKGSTVINGKTISYDTPAYVAKVQKYYQQQTQGSGGSQAASPQQLPLAATNTTPQAQGAGLPSAATLPTDQTQTTQDNLKPPEGLLSKIGKGALGVLNTIESPFIGLAAAPVQALAAATGQKDPFAQGFPGLAGSKVNVTPLDLEKKAGDAAQVGSYFVPGSGVLGAAGMGALQGAGSQMSQGRDLATTLVGGAQGAALGGAAAGATKLAGMGISKIGSALSGDAAEKATNGIRDAYSSALNLNASERAFETRTGKDLAQVLVDNGAPLARNENGTLDATAAIAKLQEAMKPLNEQAASVLSNPQGVVNNISLPDVLTQVQSRIQKLPISQLEKNAAITHAQNVIQAEATQYGAEVTPEVADQIKQGMWGSSFKGNLTSADKLQGNIQYLTGNTLKTEIEKAVAGTDAGNVLPAINKQRSDIADAIKRLSGIDGSRLLKGGKLGNMASGVMGGIAGAASGLGPLGVIGGDYFGQKAGQFLQDPATKIAIATAKAKALGKVPGLLGKFAKPVGDTISKTGSAVGKTARGAGLLTNLLTK